MSTQVRRQVFLPGFTTKMRGWGLGLSLSRRIVEEYHKGEFMCGIQLRARERRLR
jgi:signal transduction histidine kinase